jgi:hypothetical protein
VIRGGLGGVGARGGLGSIDASPPGRDWPKLLRSKDSGAAYANDSTRFHFAGQTGHDIYNSANYLPFGLVGFNNFYGKSTGAGEFLYAVPEWFPVSGTIKRLAWVCDNGVSGLARAQLHIYNASVVGSAIAAFAGWPYPGNLLVSGTEYLIATQGIEVRSAWRLMHDLVSLRVDAGTLLWFVVRGNTNMCGGGGAGLALNNFAVHPFSGYTFGATSHSADNGSAVCGWIHSHTFASGPAAIATFPQTNPLAMPCGVRIDGIGAVPTVAYGFAAD